MRDAVTYRIANEPPKRTMSARERENTTIARKLHGFGDF
jgi:hypothetical protein